MVLYKDPTYDNRKIQLTFVKIFLLQLELSFKIQFHEKHAPRPV